MKTRQRCLLPLLLVFAATFLQSHAFQIPSRSQPSIASSRSRQCQTLICERKVQVVQQSPRSLTKDPYKRTKQQPTTLFLSLSPELDDFVIDASNTLNRISWLSWWSQAILTVVSSITLLFARNVLRTAQKSPTIGGEGLVVAGTGLVVSFLSIFWTWGGARLGRRLLKKQTTRIEAANMIRRAISVGVSLNLLGMTLALIGAEQIVGTLAVKVLTQQGVLGGMDRLAVQTLQPLDILVVQGNTNTLLSHFCSLVALLYQTKLVRKLDPPSTEGDARKR